MKGFVKRTIVLLSGLLIIQPVYSLEVDREVLPRITLGGRVISTLDWVERDSDPRAGNEINVDDSALLLRLDKRTYGQAVAGAVLGFREYAGNAVFHESHVFYWNRDYEIKLGRMRLPNTLIEFPTLRDDDLLTYTHIGNASSNEEFDQIYGELLDFSWFIDRKNQSLKAWLGSRADETALGVSGLDSHGVGYVYAIPEDLRYVRWLRHAGVLVDRQKVNTGNDEKWMNALVAGAEFNLNMNPAANWSAGLQLNLVEGAGAVSVEELAGPDSIAQRARAQSRSLVAALRYTARPLLLTRWQAALSMAYKDYSDFDNAAQWTITPSFVYVLGQGIHLLAQAGYTDFDDTLGGGTDKFLQLGLAFNLDARFNDTIGERNSILNLEHGYIQ